MNNFSAASSPCDVAEFCTGTGPNCPVDQFASSSTLCRAAAGDCDVTEVIFFFLLFFSTPFILSCSIALALLACVQTMPNAARAMFVVRRLAIATWRSSATVFRAPVLPTRWRRLACCAARPATPATRPRCVKCLQWRTHVRGVLIGCT